MSDLYSYLSLFCSYPILMISVIYYCIGEEKGRRKCTLTLSIITPAEKNKPAAKIFDEFFTDLGQSVREKVCPWSKVFS